MILVKIGSLFQQTGSGRGGVWSEGVILEEEIDYVLEIIVWSVKIL